MAHADQQQSFSPDFDKSVPAYLWWNGRRVPWASATVHLTSTFWSGVTAIFEGIMSYWNEEQHQCDAAAGGYRDHRAPERIALGQRLGAQRLCFFLHPDRG